MRHSKNIDVLIGLAFRRRLAVYRHQKWLNSWHRGPHEDIERFDEIDVSGLIFIAVLALIGVGLWLAIPIFMEPLARLLGTPTILLLALMSWTVFGGFLITYLPKSLHLTGWSWMLIVFALLFYSINENHLVTDGKSGTRRVAGTPDPDSPKVSVDAAFNA